MRRALLTLGGTAAGLAALLSFKTHSLAAAAPEATSTPSASAATSQPMASGAGSSSASPAASKKASAPAGKASASSQAATRTVTGTVANTQYGPMQVQLALAGETVLEHVAPGAAPVGVVAQGRQRHAQVPRRQDPELVTEPAGRPPVVGDRDDRGDPVGHQAQRRQGR